MSKLHLNRDRQSLGQFSPEQVAEGLASGRFRPTDLAWREGLETWRPLADFHDLPVAEAEPPPIPAELPDAGPAFPWDRRAETGFWSALGETLFQSLGRPATTFRRLAPAPPTGAPYAFYLLLAMTAFAIYSAEILTLVNYSAGAIAANPELGRNPETARALALLKEHGVAWFAFLLLVMVPCLPFVAAGVFHLLLLLLAGAHESFLRTFAVTCYVFGAVSPLIILPCCGPLAMVGWALAALALGLAAAQRTEPWRAALAVGVPFVFCCGSYLALSLAANLGGLSGTVAVP